MNPSKEIINQKLAEYMDDGHIACVVQDSCFLVHEDSSICDDDYLRAAYTDSLDSLVPVWEKFDAEPFFWKAESGWWCEMDSNHGMFEGDICNTIQHAAALATYKAIIAMEKEGE